MPTRPCDDRRRGAERHAELPFEPARRPVVDAGSSARSDRRRPRSPRPRRRANRSRALQIEQRVERRMRAGARRIQLHGDAGVDESPSALPRSAATRVERRLLAVHRGEKSLRAVDRRGARGHPGPRQQRRERRRCAPPAPRAAASPSCRSSPSGPRPPTRRSPARGRPPPRRGRAAATRPPPRRSCRASTCSASRAGSGAGSSRGRAAPSISKPTT